MLEFFIDLWDFMRIRKKFWLAPIIIVLVLSSLLIVFLEGSALLETHRVAICCFLARILLFYRIVDIPLRYAHPRVIGGIYDG